MKRPYLLIITATLCLVLTGGMSLAKDSEAPRTKGAEDFPRTKSAEDKETIEACKQVVSKNPDDAKSYFNLSIAYLKSGMYQEAIESLKQAIRIDPDDVKANKTLSYIYLNLYRYEEAIESSKQVIRIKPDATAHYNLGFIYHVSNDKDSSLKQYEILKKLDSGLADKLLKLIQK